MRENFSEADSRTQILSIYSRTQINCSGPTTWSRNKFLTNIDQITHNKSSKKCSNKRTSYRLSIWSYGTAISIYLKFLPGSQLRSLKPNTMPKRNNSGASWYIFKKWSERIFIKVSRMRRKFSKISSWKRQKLASALMFSSKL